MSWPSSKRREGAGLNSPDRLYELAERLGTTFTDITLLERAMSHRSWCAETSGASSNERLEFLGDAVLGLVVTDYLFRTYPALPEGELAKVRASVVNSETLAEVAMSLELGDAVLLGKGEDASGGREKPSILADAMEAVFGAVFLDAGFAAARAAIEAAYGEILRDADPARLGKDAKTRLQEALHKRRLPEPVYEIVATTGKAHAQEFAVECRIADLGIVTRGAGASRRAAEQDAATQALDLLPKGRRNG